MKLPKRLCALIVGGGLGLAWSALASTAGIICVAVVAVCRRHSDFKEAKAKPEAKQFEARLEIVRLALLRRPDCYASVVIHHRSAEKNA